MTAEIVVMNRQGAALAADSAVTLASSKIFNTANKLYMLAPNYPVGILVYNNSTFMNLPWEVVIKEYKDNVLEKKRKFKKLEECADDFISFLKGNQDKFATTEQQKIVVTDVIGGLYGEITKRIWKRLEKIIFETSEKITDVQIRESTKAAIGSATKHFESAKDIYTEDETGKIEVCLSGSFSEIITKVRNDCFDKLPLDEDDINKLNRLCLYLFSKETVLPLYSGVVFVGYGNDDLLPKCVTYNIESLICGNLKYEADEERSQNIQFDGASAVIIPLAQADIVQNFIFGAHPAFMNTLKDKLLRKLKIPNEETEAFLHNLEQEMFEKYTSSILQTVNSLPKEDLAIMAETLVNLTSFMRKVSMSVETVGGPIDVAVISKQDGFIWIKRKHYFEYQDNLHLSSLS